MFNDIKITMLGTSGAGKTCYMLGMYAIMQLGVEGFTLSAKDMDEDLELTDKWDALVDGQGEQRWPLGTDKPHTYAFDFSYGMRPIMGFEWLDYRGGAMSDRSTEQDVEVLRNYLKSSDCVFLCISGEYLKTPGEAVSMSSLRKAKVNAMNQYMAQLAKTIQPSNNKPFPVVIAITKYDLCKHRSKDEIFQDVQTMFGPLFTPDSGWLVMVCPVSLGGELAENLNAGEIVPRNVHLPLAFAIYAQIQKYVLEEKGRSTNLNEKITALKNQNAIMRLLYGNDINAAQQELANSQSRLAQIQEKLSLLARKIGDAEIYLSGEEIEVNV